MMLSTEEDVNSMKKLVVYEEIGYLIGLILLGLGTAFMEYSNLGLNMVVAPAYVLHVKISQYLPFYSFGMSGYVLQIFLLLALCLVLRKFKPIFLMSFVTAVLYGFILDGFVWLFRFMPEVVLYLEIISFIIGLLISTLGLAFLFGSYVSPEVYDLSVKEITKHYNLKLNRVKTVYDCISLLFAVLLSLVLFGLQKPVGIGIGTVICALVNGTMINFFTKKYDKVFEFKRFFSPRE